ncbi:hypothetical protein DXG01_004654 [Tephrocybe rancida]|nr:hypothetical protein DXG01_004654 [Tephrocybe rancida]
MGTNDKFLKSGSNVSSESRKLQKSQVIIRRPVTHKVQPRAHLSSEIDTPDMSPMPFEDAASPILVDSLPLPQPTSELALDELSRIRALLLPPPIPDVDDWGIPTASHDPPDSAITTKLAQFNALKADTTNPKHFNDSLMSNRSFRNPHLYTKLVEFVDVDERATNFPRHIWVPDDFQPDWFADRIADYQRSHSDQAAASQSAGKRSQINFASSSSSAAKAKEREREKAAGLGSAVGRKSRFQPYYFEPGNAAAAKKDQR